MRKFFNEVMSDDIFLRLKEDFGNMVLECLMILINRHPSSTNVLTSGVIESQDENGETIFEYKTDSLSFEDWRKLKRDEYIKNELLLNYSKIQKKVIDSLFEFSMQEKFYYISKALTDYQINHDNNYIDLYKYVDKVYLKPLKRDFNYNSSSREKINDCDNLLKSHFINYAKIYFDVYEKLHTLFESLYHEFKEGRLSDESKLDVNEYILKQKPIFTLHPDFKISQLNGKVEHTKLKKNQIAILFEYLSKYEVFLNFDKKTKAYFASILTGNSEKILETEAFANKKELQKGKMSVKTNSTDIKVVREILNKLIIRKHTCFSHTMYRQQLRS
jgi:uncharacterized protein YegP (UPF0339 family)